MRNIFIVLVIFICSHLVIAQSNHLNVELSSQINLSTGRILPMWQRSNVWSVVDSYDKNQIVINPVLRYSFLNTKWSEMTLGVGGLVNAEGSNHILHELFLKGQIVGVDFSIGKEAYSPVAYDDELGSGNFLMSSNAYPIPKISVGIYKYKPLGFLHDFISIKGGLNHGWLNDDRLPKGKDDVLLHEKWAYIRVGDGKAQPYFGLVHSVLMGGTYSDGSKLPIDYFNSILGKSSDKIGGGDATNAGGAHMGLFDVGTYLKGAFGTVQMYWQKPFVDGSGMNINRSDFYKDYIIGALVHLDRHGIVNEFAVELINTMNQGGPGFADPLYPKGHPREGQIIWMKEIKDDLDGFMNETFGVTSIGWKEDQVWQYIIDNLNHGYLYGGRDDYLDNGSYYNGWTYNGSSIGFPLFHTYDQINTIAPNNTISNKLKFSNTRLRGFNVGVKGQISKRLNYLLKYTYTENFGTYSEQYESRVSWQKVDNYFFEGGLVQNYSLCSLIYDLKSNNHLQIQGSVAADFGELYNSYGIQLMLKWQLH